MAPRKPEALPRSPAVAYLVANVERLTGTGAFAGRPAARTVFLHLCCHPGGNVPHPDKLSSWACPVASPHHKPADIAEATGLTPRGVEKALDWLASEGFINQDRGSKKRKSYGPATIVATHWLSDWKRTQFATHPRRPAIGTQFATKEPSSLNDCPATPKRPRRTVAATRPTSANGYDLGPSGTLESAGEARNTSRNPRPSRSERSEQGVRPGTPPTAIATTADTATAASAANDSAVRDLPGECPVPVARLGLDTHAGDDADAEVDRVMALLSDLPGWDTAAVAVGA
jgi:hypothetical protein